MKRIKRKKVIISVISDLVTDQRVHRTALTLHNAGMEVLLVGREKSLSLSMGNRPYSVHRIRLRHEKGVLLYLFFNLSLFFFLIKNKADVLFANDLDTLAPNYLISRFRKSKLIYDSHEYFTQVPELQSRPAKRKIWERIEQYIFPRLKNVITVNESIATIYREKYNVDVEVIRNFPIREDGLTVPTHRTEVDIPENKKIFLMQGAGININRGAEEAILAIENVDAFLVIIGGGDVYEQLKNMVTARNLGHKVFFFPLQPLDKLRSLTAMADFGLTLDKDSNPNYHLSLPNKLFDYIQAGLPVLATAVPEVKKIVQGYDIGMITSTTDPYELAGCMRKMMNDEEQIAKWKNNLNIAASELCWENEQHKLLAVFNQAIA